MEVEVIFGSKLTIGLNVLYFHILHPKKKKKSNYFQTHLSNTVWKYSFKHLENFKIKNISRANFLYVPNDLRIFQVII